MITRRSALLFSIAVFMFAATASAATIRGRVLRPDGRAYAGVKVAVQSPAIGRSATILTADDGVFQMRNVPAGEYTMEVRTAGSTATFRITVDQRPMVDLAPVTVR